MSSMEPGWLAEELTPRLADWCVLHPSEAAARIEVLTKEVERLRAIETAVQSYLAEMDSPVRDPTMIKVTRDRLRALSVPSQEGGT